MIVGEALTHEEICERANKVSDVNGDEDVWCGWGSYGRS